MKFIIVCPRCECEDFLVEIDGYKFECESCECEFDFHEAEYKTMEGF